MKFKVGDRIAIYENGCRTPDKITEIKGDLIMTTCYRGPYHQKQCRLIKPRKPLREIWRVEYPNRSSAIYSDHKSALLAANVHHGELIHFREVREKKK